MTARLGVSGGVPVRRIVAAQRGATLLARPKVDPLGSDLHTFLAFAMLRMRDRLDRTDVGATLLWHATQSLSAARQRFLDERAETGGRRHSRPSCGGATARQ